MANYKTAVPPRNAAMDALGARLNNGTIEIRSGGPPTNVTDASTGDLLGVLTFAATAFGAAVNGQIDANAIGDEADALASGDAGYFRLYAAAAGDTACESQGDAGEALDTPDMEFDNKAIVINGTISINTLTITMPE